LYNDIKTKEKNSGYYQTVLLPTFRLQYFARNNIFRLYEHLAAYLTGILFKMNLLKKNIICLLFVFYPLVAFSQAPDSSEQKILQAVKLYRAGNTLGASKLLLEINRDTPGNIQVLGYLGQIQALKRNWGKAKDYFQQVLKINENDFLAMYYLGICYRESGKFKAFLLRRRDWGKSERYFKAVIKARPNLKDVQYQFGLLERYRKHFFKAIDWGEKQLEITPAVPAIIIGIHRFYDSLLYHKGEKTARRWLEKRTGHRPLLYIGESYRREKDFNKADSIFNDLLTSQDENFSLVPVRLALARSMFEQDKPEECQHYYDQAVDSMRTLTDAALIFEELKYVFSDKEYDEYQRIRNLDGKRTFFQKFWLKRAPMPGSAINLRLIEHFRRILYAEKYFRYDGFRTLFNNPDKLHYLTFPRVFSLNQKFNDKGLIYIRQGDPDDKAFDLNGANGVMPSQTGVNATPSNESWLYYANGLHKKLMFHFFIDKNGTGNNWRLAAIVPREILDSRLEWDSIFQRLYTADPIEVNSLQEEMAMRSRADAYQALNSDQHSWHDKIHPIAFPFYISTFRGDGYKTRYEIYYGLNPKDFVMDNKEPSPDQKIELGFAAYDSKWNQLYRMDRTITVGDVKTSADSLGFWIGQYAFQAVPQEINMNIFLRMPQQNGIGGYKFKYGMAIYHVENLKMSSIELAKEIIPTDENGPYVKNGLRVFPNPQRVFNRSDPVNIYFEIYNLPIGDKKSVAFNLNYKIKLLKRTRNNIFTKIKGLFSGGSKEISNLVERFSNSDTSVEYLSLDLSHQDPGQYELEITTSVKGMEDTATSKIGFELQ